MKTINQDIKEENFRPVYLLYGEEDFLRRAYKNRLKEAIVGDDTMNYSYYEGKEIDVNAVISTAETMPFFAPRRLIILENSGLFKKDAEALASYLPELPETTHMIFVEKEIDKRNRLYKKVTTLGYAAECEKQTPAELKHWAARGFAASGKKITEATMELFLMKTGDDMENIRREMEKLCAYLGDREIVEVADVNTMTTTQVSDHIFDMITEVTVGHQERALELYADLLSLKTPPMLILTLLSRQFQTLLSVKDLRDQGADKSEIASRCKLKPFVAGRTMTQASRFSSEELLACMKRCAELDDAIKKGNLRDQLAVELLIVELSGIAGTK